MFCSSNVDIDECTKGTHNCDNNATCGNTGGSFTCQCNTGFYANGTHCIGMLCYKAALQWYITCSHNIMVYHMFAQHYGIPGTRSIRVISIQLLYYCGVQKV